MGYIRHDALLMHTWRDGPEAFAEMRAEADTFADGTFARLLVGPVPVVVNSGATMVYCPDGSKEGWQESDSSDELRDRLIAIADRHGLDWVQVSFGGDDYDRISVRQPWPDAVVVADHRLPSRPSPTPSQEPHQ